MARQAAAGKKFFTCHAGLQYMAAPFMDDEKTAGFFLAGEFDEATPASTEKFSRLVPGSEFAIIPNSGHSTENDNPEALIATVRAFLRRVDAGEPVRASAP